MACVLRLFSSTDNSKIAKMKNRMFMKKIFKMTGMLLVAFLFHSCSIYNKIYSEEDIVYGIKRFELKYYIRDLDRRSPVIYFTQSIVKEISPKNEVSYTAYDVLTLSSSSFKLDDKVILLIDNESFPMKIENLELENVRTTTENTSDILTSDSTKVSVISGYSENNTKISRFSYKIPPDIIAKIRSSEKFSFRYYSGPSMITLQPKPWSIQKFKQLIDSE